MVDPAVRPRQHDYPCWTSVVLDLILLTLAQGALFASYFCGFGLGDDVSYDDLATRILDEGYPPARELLVFAGRPVLLYLISASYWLLGRSELAFVAPTMVAALLCVTSAYGFGRLAGGRRAGLAAGAVLMVSTLHAAYATTMTNDIIGTAWLSTAALLAVATARVDHRMARAAAMLAGVIGTASWGVKPSFTLISVTAFAAIIGCYTFWRRAGLALWLCAGILLAAVSFMVFFAVTSGDPFAAIRVEMSFNRTHVLPGASARPTSEILSFYPLTAFGLAPVGPGSYQWLPAGWFFPVTFVALAFAAVLRRYAALAHAGVMCAVLLTLQFWPLQFSPYVPIHRLPRFLYPALLPGAVVVGLLAAGTGGRRRGRALVLAVGFTAYAWSSLGHAGRATTLHRDSMADVRFVAEIAANSDRPIAVDDELVGYIRFRARAARREPLLLRLSPDSVGVAGTMAVVGGSRRPELAPDYAISVAPLRIPPTWIPVLTLPGEIRPWRPWRGTIYLIEPSSAGDSLAGTMREHCPSGRTWVLRDLVDIGDQVSEATHEYVAHEVTWRGTRVLRAGPGDLSDGGVAFKGSQSFLIRGLRPAFDVCVVKRIDPRVRDQESTMRVDGGVPLPVRVLAATADQWGVAMALLPGAAIGSSELRFFEEFVRSSLDINAFRLEIYQASAGLPER